MTGATTLVWAKMSRSPKSARISTIGASQNFFCCQRNSPSSRKTRALPTSRLPLVHPLVVPGIALPRRVRDPPASARVPAPPQRIPPRQPEDEAERRQDEEKQGRQEDPRVEPAEPVRQRPPRAVREPEQGWPDQGGQDERRRHDPEDQSGRRPPTQEEIDGEKRQDPSHREAERPFLPRRHLSQDRKSTRLNSSH